MNDTDTINDNHDGPACYEIRIKGHVSDYWASWFEGLNFEHSESGETHFTCQVADQAALHGLLRKIRDSGLQLLSINRISTSQDQD